MQQTLSIETIPVWLPIAGTTPEESTIEKNCKRSSGKPGFQRLRLGDFTIPYLDKSQEAELSKLQGSKTGRNLIGKYSADIMILLTAMKKHMDFVVTDDKKWEKLLEKLKELIMMLISKKRLHNFSK